MRTDSLMELYDKEGHRKYLTLAERKVFRNQAQLSEREVRTFCLILLNTGCRISEALNLEVRHIDFSDGTVIIESLKKRKRGVFRHVPLSADFLDELNLVHDLHRRSKSLKSSKQRIWNWSRSTAFRRVSEVMGRSGIHGQQSSAKGLRHSFAIACLEHKVPLPIVQKWLGHSSLNTTAIYANAMGQEEVYFAKFLWENE